jgi:hypothetical protein
MAEITYLLPVGETIGIAWDKVKGTKGSVWAAILMTSLIMLGLGFFDWVIRVIAPPIEPFFRIIVQVIGFLLQMGIMYIGIRRAQDLPITYRMMFRTFEGSIAIRVIGVYILQIIIFIIPVALIIFSAVLVGRSGAHVAILLGIFGFVLTIFLCVRMMLSMAFVLDKGTNPWPAISQSFASTKNNFWRLVAIFLAQSIIIIISAIPIFIGLIWTLPFAYILYGLVYKNLSLNSLSRL